MTGGLLLVAVSAARANGIWIPPLNTSWQWQLTGTVDQSYNVDMYDNNVFENDAGIVSSLHAKGYNVIGYISMGSWESWCPDADTFPESVLGKSLEGWPGERWLDIRRIDILGPIMTARMDQCKQKGFDGIEPDNIDAYVNDSGFPLTYEDQVTYNTFLANEAHARGLSIGLKNDLDQIIDLLPYFDWALNEQCFQYNECDKLTPFTTVSRAVFQVEYYLPLSMFCPQAIRMDFNSMKKHLSLDAWREPCPEVPQVQVALIPDATVIPRGGTLGYSVAITNNTTSSQTFRFWTYVILPNGQRYPVGKELFGPVTVTLSAGKTKSTHLTQKIPTTAPLGTYTYYGNVGPYPTVWDSDSFEFTVTAAAEPGGTAQEEWEIIEDELTE